MVKQLPEPKCGQIIQYSYLWYREAVVGQEEGRKDRPCAIILTAKDGRIGVVPLTTSKPSNETPALELPPAIGKQLGFGEKASWIIVNEVNLFKWPGLDIRPVKKDQWIFGQLPPNFTKAILQGVKHQRSRIKSINRDEEISRKKRPG